MLLASKKMYTVIAFLSRRLDKRITIDEVASQTGMRHDQVLTVLDQLDRLNICTKTDDLVVLNVHNYKKLLQSEIKEYDQLIEKIDAIKSRIYHLGLSHPIENESVNLEKPMVIVESISDDKKYIHKVLSEINNLEIQIYTTHEIMNMYLENRTETSKLEKGIILFYGTVEK